MRKRGVTQWSAAGASQFVAMLVARASRPWVSGLEQRAGRPCH